MFPNVSKLSCTSIKSAHFPHLPADTGQTLRQPANTPAHKTDFFFFSLHENNCLWFKIELFKSFFSTKHLCKSHLMWQHLDTNRAAPRWVLRLHQVVELQLQIIYHHLCLKSVKCFQSIRLSASSPEEEILTGRGLCICFWRFEYTGVPFLDGC